MKTKTVPAKVYGLRVCEGAMGFIHGQFIPMQEIFIPSLGVAFNMGVDGEKQWNCFETTEDQRYQTKGPDDNQNGAFLRDIEIPQKVVDTIKAYMESRKRMDEEVAEQLGDMLKS